MIQRYDFRPTNYGDGEPDQCTSDDGGFVEYPDHIAAMASLEQKLATANALLREYKDALETIRDAVLNERGPMAESGMTSDQVNAVLGVIDDETPDAVRTDAHLNL